MSSETIVIDYLIDGTSGYLVNSNSFNIYSDNIGEQLLKDLNMALLSLVPHGMVLGNLVNELAYARYLESAEYDITEAGPRILELEDKKTKIDKLVDFNDYEGMQFKIAFQSLSLDSSQSEAKLNFKVPCKNKFYNLSLPKINIVDLSPTNKAVGFAYYQALRRDLAIIEELCYKFVRSNSKIQEKQLKLFDNGNYSPTFEVISGDQEQEAA